MKRLALPILALVLVASPLRAQGVDVQVEAGWDGAFVEDHWVPLRVTVTAPAGAPSVTGRLVCEPVLLERVPGCDARFAVTPTREAPGVALVTLAVPARGDLSFTVVAEDEHGRELARSSPRDLPRRLDPKDRLVLLVGRRAGLAALESAAAPLPVVRPGPSVVPNPAGRAGTVRVARIGPEDFPDRSWVLGGTTVFLEEGPGMVDLARDEARMAALDAYVRGGATLVVVGGRGVAFWAGSRLEELLPVLANGATVSARARDLGLSGSTATGIPVSRVTVRTDLKRKAEILVGSDELPIVVRRAHGRGDVVFLAFDPDNLELRAIAELPPFLGRLVPTARTKPPHVRPDRLSDLTTRDLLERSPIGPAGLLGLAAAAAAALVIMGPIGARRRNAPARVLVAPALSALLATLIVIVAALGRPPLDVTVFAYAFVGSDEDQAVVIEDTAVLAGGSTTFDVELFGQATILPLETPKVDLLAFRGRRSDLRLEPGANARIPNVALGARGLSTFRTGAFVTLPARLVARLEGVALDLEAVGGALPGGIVLHEDATTHALTTCPTPALAPGEKTRVTVDQPFAALRTWDEGAPPLWERSAEDRTRAQLIRALALVADEVLLLTQQKQGPPFPRTWVALPAPLERLARIVEGGKPVAPSTTLPVLLVATEERP